MLSIASSVARAARSAATRPGRASVAPFSSSAHKYAMTGPEIQAVYDNHFSPGAARLSNIVVDTAKGTWINDLTTGKSYLDCACGIGATNLGHCHPKIVAAAQGQLSKGIHLQQNLVMQQPVAELMTKLNEITPDNISRFFFNSTGSEAVESAIKLARHATGRPNIVTFQGGFHGRTIATMSLTSSKYIYAKGYAPLMAGVHRVPYPYCIRCPGNPTGDSCSTNPDFECCGNSLEQLRNLLKQASHPSDTAAVLVEPVQGEGGFIVPPKGFFEGLRQICDENDILLIADEVQAGFGRTGEWFSIYNWDCKPDLMVMAKGLGSGMPIAAIAGRPDLFFHSTPGSMGGTYGASAVSAAAACATIDTIRDDRILENVRARGAQLEAALNGLKAKYSGHIKDSRGLGLMRALEFHDKHVDIANKVSAAALENEVILMVAGAYEAVRFLPPLTISEEEMDMIIERVSKAVDTVVKSY